MDFWNKVPYVRLLIPLILGVVLELEELADIRIVLPLFFCFSIVFVTLCLVPRTRHFIAWNQLTGSIALLTMLSFGFVLTYFNRDINYPTHFSHAIHDQHTRFVGVVYEPPQEKARSVKAFIEINQIEIDGKLENVQGNMLVYFQKSDAALNLNYGDLVAFECQVQDVKPPDNPQQFDFKRYLRNNNIYHQAYIKNDAWLNFGEKYANPAKQIAYDVRKSLLKILKKHVPEDRNFAVGSALILGYKDRLDPDMLRTFSSAGAMHVLAVSGLHVGIIFIMLNHLLKFLDDKGRKGALLRAGIIITVLWIYAFITGLSPSVLRAATMFSFVVIGSATDRATNIYNTLSASAFLLICIDPLIITKVGFQLSYLAVIGIVYLQPKIYTRFYFKRWLPDKIWAITSVSFAAQLATFPLGLYYFHQFPNYFFISNLLVIPLATFILYAGILVLFLSLFGIANYVDWLLNAFLTLLNRSVAFVEEIPHSLIYGNFISTAEVLLMYLFVGLILIWVYTKRKIALLGIIASVTALILISAFGRYSNGFQRKMIVYKVPNSTVINFMNGDQNILVSDSTFLVDENQQLYYVKHYWYSRGFTESKNVNLNQDLKKGFVVKHSGLYQAKDFKMFRYEAGKSSFNLLNPLKVDCLVLSGDGYFDLDKITAKIQSKQIILDSSIPYYKADKIERLLLDSGHKVINIHRGAHIIDF